MAPFVHRHRPSTPVSRHPTSAHTGRRVADMLEVGGEATDEAVQNGDPIRGPHGALRAVPIDQLR